MEISVKGSAGAEFGDRRNGRSGRGRTAKPTLVLQKALDVLDAFTLAAPELTLPAIREAR
jgi:hypothetical protein